MQFHIGCILNKAKRTGTGEPWGEISASSQLNLLQQKHEWTATSHCSLEWQNIVYYTCQFQHHILVCEFDPWGRHCALAFVWGYSQKE